MVQIGLNMGPRHARVLGWAKSFVKNLTQDEMVHEDSNLIGAMSLLWALVIAYLPSDITSPVQALLDKDYPALATRNIPAGKAPVFFLWCTETYRHHGRRLRVCS